MVEHTRVCRFPVVWLIASASILLVYLFSIGWRSELTVVRNEHYYTMVLADGRFAFHTRGVPKWADQSDFTLETVSWSMELKLLPRIRWYVPAGMIVELPLWIIALPVWLITLVRWRRCRRRPPGVCRKCGYDLRESAAGRCPECGADCKAQPKLAEP